MKRFRNLLPLMAILSGAVLLGTPTQADAAFKIRVSENGGTTYVVNVTDNDVVNHGTAGGGVGSGDVSGQTGGITVIYSDAMVSFSVFVGQSKPLFGNTPFLAAMDISIGGTFLTGGTLTVDITDTDFAPPASPSGLGGLTASIGSSAPAGTTFVGYLNGEDPNTAGLQGNKEFGGIDLPTTGTLLTTPTATAPGNLTTTAIGTAFAPYSMTARTVFSGGPGSGFSIDNKLTFSVPAPPGLVLALAGAPVLAFGAWVRRRRVPATA